MKTYSVANQRVDGEEVDRPGGVQVIPQERQPCAIFAALGPIKGRFTPSLGGRRQQADLFLQLLLQTPYGRAGWRLVPLDLE